MQWKTFIAEVMEGNQSNLKVIKSSIKFLIKASKNAKNCDIRLDLIISIIGG